MTWLINLCAILVSAEGAPGRNVDYNACLAVAGEALRDKGIEVFPLWRTLASPQNRFNNFVAGSLVVSGEPVTYEGETGWDKIASSVLESVGLAHRPGDTCWADEPHWAVSVRWRSIKPSTIQVNPCCYSNFALGVMRRSSWRCWSKKQRIPAHQAPSHAGCSKRVYW
jgi:hypothetical protein